NGLRREYDGPARVQWSDPDSGGCRAHRELGPRAPSGRGGSNDGSSRILTVCSFRTEELEKNTLVSRSNPLNRRASASIRLPFDWSLEPARGSGHRVGLYERGCSPMGADGRGLLHFQFDGQNGSIADEPSQASDA